MKTLTINNHESKRSLLDYAFNALGCFDLHMCCSSNAGENYPSFSRWVSYETLMHLEDSQVIPHSWPRMSKRRFLECVAHRTVLDIEVVFDVDDVYYGKGAYDSLEETPRFSSIKAKSEWIVKELKSHGAKDVVVHESGGKGYHISILLPLLRGMEPWVREEFKRELLLAYGADPATAGRKHMISMEGSFHRKTGRLKQEIEVK